MKQPQCLPQISVPSTRTRQRLRSRDWPRAPRRDPHARIIAQLVQLSGPDMTVIASSSRLWASATFVGAQHRVVLRFSGGDAPANAARFAELLPDAEFSIAGHIVADACVDEWGNDADQCVPGGEPLADEPRGMLALRVTVLTVEDW